MTGAIFVCGISAWYLLRNRHVEMARRSFRIASLFGVLATLGVITLGDALGFIGGQAQPTKLAAMEALWESEPAPMPFNLIAFPSQEEQTNFGEVQIPYALSLLVTHSLHGTVPGALELQQQAEQRIRNGIPAVKALQALSADPGNPSALASFRKHEDDLGYGFLAHRYAADIDQVTEADIARAARDSIPPVATVFWSFRVMVAFGLLMLAFFVLANIYTLNNTISQRRWFLHVAVWMIPIPFLANEAGWLVAELGRQPWTVFGMLPTWMSASTHSLGYMIFSLGGFLLLYSIFAVVEMVLMIRAIRKGPSGDNEQPSAPAAHPRARLAAGAGKA